jgi:hypothetical protein
MTPPPSHLHTWLGLLLRFAAGVALGIFFHYLLYRIFLPAEPFIYTAF